ncbi:MAG: rRNA cytosine-C5-methyltransferase [Bacteroidales bacterium]|nr:rRNA cytosine-C5-methyltransferase [Bacteroidales bacterium]
MGNPLTDTFRHYLTEHLGEYATPLAEALEKSAPSVAVRINRRKRVCTSAIFPDIADGSVPWCEEGIYLSERPDFTHDPRLHQGLYYVQDASSMAVAKAAAYLTGLMELPEGESLRYLDACAAPGGKTTSAIASLPDDALVVANEFDYRRAEILKENVIKWGSPATVVSRGDTSRFLKLKEFFHIVAADVPCSGEGMMRKDAKAVAQWSPALVGQCVERQKEIILNLWETLMPGGYLIYSTCTFNRHENEEIISWIADELGGEPVETELEFPGALKTGLMYRFLPGRVRGEGLALGIVRKPGDLKGAFAPKNSRKQKGGNASKVNCAGAIARITAQAAGWLAEQQLWTCTLRGEEIIAYPARHAEAISRLEKALDIIHTGVNLGTVKGKGIVPDQSLAMSTSLRGDAFPTEEVSLEKALSYLRRESSGGFDAPRGPVLLTFENAPLGFVNNLGNRANNLYPAAWRILH